MKKYYLLGAVLLLFGCSTFTESAEEEQGIDLTEFDSKFSTLTLESGEKLDCTEITFGEDSTYQLIPSATMETVISEPLREKSLYESSEKHFALGKFPYSDQLVGYWVGAYTNRENYSTHLFLWDKSASQFSHAQSLNYQVQAGSFHSKRDAWLKDVNEDQHYDIVYFMEESRAGSEHGEDYAVYDSVRVEAWDGGQFSEFYIEDPEVYRSEYAGGTLDDFF